MATTTAVQPSLTPTMVAANMGYAKKFVAVVDRLTGDVVSRHRSYKAADKAATKRGERYAVRADRAYA